MSIREEVKARQRQQNQREAVRSKEAEARPDALHRALVFALRALRENNPDLTEEVNHHIATLDKELATDKLAEIEKPREIEKDAADEDDETDPAEPPDTAKAIRQSARFKRARP